VRSEERFRGFEKFGATSPGPLWLLLSQRPKSAVRAARFAPPLVPATGDTRFHVADGKVRTQPLRNTRKTNTYEKHEDGRSLFGTSANPMTSDPSVAGTDAVCNTNRSGEGKLLALRRRGQQSVRDVTGERRVAWLSITQAKRCIHRGITSLDPETGRAGCSAALLGWPDSSARA